jgi:serine/threonine protein phosphatase PrpC
MTSEMRFVHVTEVVPAKAAGQDRARVFVRPDRIVIALADGAGGIGNGALVAQAFVDAVEGAEAGDETNWCTLIESLDQELLRINGQTTAVVLSIGPLGVSGASVGDSGVWLVDDGNVVDLTHGQHRKPLVGGGGTPVAFRAGSIGNSTLIVASDGLFRYLSERAIARIAGNPELAVAARELVAAVRLPSGALQDDVSIVLCRRHESS